MGNGIGKLNLCFAGDPGEISRRRTSGISFPLTTSQHHQHPDVGLGHSFFYARPDPGAKTDSVRTAAFRTISGASISANASTPLSTTVMDLSVCDNFALDKAASFQSSDSFSSMPLQPIPRGSIPTVRSGPIPTVRSGSGPIERGFLSGPIERSFLSGPLEIQDDQFQRYKPKSKKFALMKSLRKTLEKSIAQTATYHGSEESSRIFGSDQNPETSAESICSNNISSQLTEDDGDEFLERENVQWAQGKAGEDRIHVVISEEHGWDFIGIYDGFNGPDATDFLLNNLYSNIYKEIHEFLSNDNNEQIHDELDSVSISLEKFTASTSTVSNSEYDAKRNGCSNPRKRVRGVKKKKETKHENKEDAKHSKVLKALSDGLRKTEEAYLEIADMMLVENPELALMGSCVLVMLMKGDDVYLMNVGDSRAILATKPESLNRDELDIFPSLDACQLSSDHSTSVLEEVRRIRKEHRDDAFAVVNGRVKGSLKVTRAFGAGFLKQPKWNNALLEMFRIDYVGSLPYITTSPSLRHHRLSRRDKFLILSSDGLYQYLTNEEAVFEVETFISSFPEGDPAQHLVEEVVFRAAKQAGMDFHELLDIPQGDRRRYHDDVSVIIISFEGRIWRSSV